MAEDPGRERDHEFRHISARSRQHVEETGRSGAAVVRDSLRRINHRDECGDRSASAFENEESPKIATPRSETNLALICCEGGGRGRAAPSGPKPPLLRRRRNKASLPRRGEAEPSSGHKLVEEVAEPPEMRRWSQTPTDNRSVNPTQCSKAPGRRPASGRKRPAPHKAARSPAGTRRRIRAQDALHHEDRNRSGLPQSAICSRRSGDPPFKCQRADRKKGARITCIALCRRLLSTCRGQPSVVSVKSRACRGVRLKRT